MTVVETTQCQPVTGQVVVILQIFIPGNGVDGIAHHRGAFQLRAGRLRRSAIAAGSTSTTTARAAFTTVAAAAITDILTRVIGIVCCPNCKISATRAMEQQYINVTKSIVNIVIAVRVSKDF
ncbi:hypothetical protein [Dyella subtropica]|uniref:hypothetical protein n=1 Tax=Dyella subtropica TaxID=2992127 RepID=UPI0022513392|nr:hypothetical protein [Dyella subtropica]